MKRPKPLKTPRGGGFSRPRPNKKKRKPRRDLETPIHVEIFNFLQTHLLSGSMVHHSPNEVDLAGEHAKRIIIKARKMGTQKGWPDLEAVARQHTAPAIFFVVEVKSEHGVMAAEQIERRKEFRALGIPHCIARSVQDVRDFLEWEGIDHHKTRRDVQRSRLHSRRSE